MQKQRIDLITFLLITSGALHAARVPALTIAPVADLIGFSFNKKHGASNSTRHYQAVPFCKKSPNSCPRLHQLLYNEQVDIVQTEGDEVRIELHNVFFQTRESDKKHTSYWTHKRNIMPLEALQKRGVDLATLPKPVSFTAPSTKQEQNIVTLLVPYADPATKRTYSAGTRFVRAEQHNKDTSTIAVHALQPRTLKPILITLPEASTLAQQPATPKEQQKLFVAILKQWAHQNKGFIPYVWGGCSFTGLCANNNFKTHKRKTTNGTIEYYQYPSCHARPCGGFDCTGIIARATQLAGMPYYFKNTTTLAQNLRTLQKKESIEDGDVIWFSGHVLVVADTKKHTAVEARGYDHGFGKIQELPLSELFEEIETYKQLAAALFAKKPLKRLTNKGKVAQSISHFKILKMKSLWNS